MRNSFLILFLFCSSLNFAQEGPLGIPKIVVKIPLNETIHLNNVSIKFVEVLEDSRCPTYITCVWAGRARVLVELRANNKESFQKVLLFGEILTGETKNNVLFISEENIVSGIDLFPLPTSKVDEERGPFELMIYIEKK